ncbi:hypothetical protein [Mycolicibacterium sp. CR10]|uniref:hypothetical protein n=1 Tax=Mycolicibacterium sp. CR10 TaxID=2562314 RepID=UPI0010BF7AC5|nr:hypothetical protein [Mycolicibacterium sp. CR10]
MSSIEIKVDADHRYQLELSDLMASLEGVESIDESADGSPDQFGAETVALIWLVTVATASAAVFIARAVQEIRKRSSHGIIVDLSGEKPVITSLKDHPVAQGTIVIRSALDSEVRMEEAPKLVEITDIIQPLLGSAE